MSRKRPRPDSRATLVPLQVGDFVLSTLTDRPGVSPNPPFVACVVQLNIPSRQSVAQYNSPQSKFDSIAIDLTSATPSSTRTTFHTSNPTETDSAYISFVGRDRRLDRWVDTCHLIRASPADIAAAKYQEQSNGCVESEIKLTRARRRAKAATNPISEQHGHHHGAQTECLQTSNTTIKNISKILFGRYFIDAWYYSPFPSPFSNTIRNVYMCGTCLYYVPTKPAYLRHLESCAWETPPGYRIYEDRILRISVYEIDPILNWRYCQAICLLAKLFLDHKTLFCDVTPFLFYVVTLDDELAGFFSKEHPKIESEFNVACILTLPPHQKKGLGKFLIALSYELTKREGKTAGPEHPLSDLGQLSYRSYWSFAIINYLIDRDCKPSLDAKVCVKEISRDTGIRFDDVVYTLKVNGIYSLWRDEHFAKAGRTALDAVKRTLKPPHLPFRTEKLHATSYAQKPNDSPVASYAPKSLPSPKLKSAKAKRSTHVTKVSQTTKTTHVRSNSLRIAKKMPNLKRSCSLNSPGTSASLSTFNSLQNQRLAMFIQTHTPERVFAGMDIPGASDLKKYVEALADEIDMHYDTTCRKLKSMTAEMVSKAHSSTRKGSRHLRNGLSKKRNSCSEMLSDQNGAVATGIMKGKRRSLETMPTNFMLVERAGGAVSLAGYTAPKPESEVVFVASQSSDD